eukprot:GFKZ01009441.1.p1 GENE.GFKZ01009441.1~~GFKZ01009441.1.p1  ORF type:complete len:869 (-),score=60.35 GFKZ01009441.1:1107-3713(-)
MDNSSSRTPSSNCPPTHDNSNSLSGPPTFSAPQQSQVGASRFPYPQNNNSSTQTSLFPTQSLAKQLAPPIPNPQLTSNHSQSALRQNQPAQATSGNIQPPLRPHRSRPLDLSHSHRPKQTPSLPFPVRSSSSHLQIPSSLPPTTQTRSQLHVPLPPSSIYSQPLSHHSHFAAAQGEPYRPLDVQGQAHSSAPLPTHQPALQNDFNRAAQQFAIPSTTASNFPPSSPHLQTFRSEPFPNSKSLPFPNSQHQPPASPVAQSSTGRPHVTASAPASLSAVTLQQNGPSNTATLHSTSTNLAHHQASMQSFVLYDIAKLQAAKCSIIGGKVYNDKGHSICGVLNQHDKPCRRIGKCPFHGVATPVSAENSCNGIVDANGTAISNDTGDDVVSPTVLSPMAAGDGSGSVPAATAPPKKQQYKHGWSKEEHYLFLKGLQTHERGSWKQISNLVQSRNATQVQSHAQKYFLRQKQNNKNKRSIHDLTMESPEMQEMDRKYRSGELRINANAVSAGVTDNVYGLNVGDGPSGRLRDTHGSAIGSMMGMAGTNHAGIVGTDNLGAGVISDSNFARFGSHGPSTVGARYGPGQAMSATTLGSSMSSGVQIPQLTGSIHQRAGLHTSAPLMSYDFMGGGSHGTISSHKKLSNIAFTRPGPIAESRDMSLADAKPMLSHLPYSTPAPALTSIAKPENRISDASILGTAADRGADGNHEGGHGQSTYASGGFPTMYAQANHSSLFPPTQPRPASEGQVGWQYGSDFKIRRPNPPNAKEAIQIQGPFAGISNLPIADGYNNISSVNQVDHTIEGAGNQHGSAFAGGLFPGTDGVDIGEGGTAYGAHGGAAQGMNGFGTNGLQLGGVGGGRGHGGMQSSYGRN